MCDSQPYYSYVAVRTDIPLADQMVQAVHAGQEAAFAVSKPDRPVHLVLFQVKNEEELLKVASKLHLEHRLFYEPDDGMAHTALATLPTLERKVKAFNRLKLWGK